MLVARQIAFDHVIFDVDLRRAAGIAPCATASGASGDDPAFRGEEPSAADSARTAACSGA
jgi:hypothetical protein